ncbi:SNF2-related protein [Hyphococcus luteus]|uniref:Helicase C-terminal domain-containing protein n=1 Tax=Hyphococcus luteus TaxID=2058213 RepID=A0A2S7K058_9PROT|nr:SNF2-related protein [Marinicaulis flavus]PQA85890.1 hypothetical protein CW354_20395 [Marinicaulis flavus]
MFDELDPSVETEAAYPLAAFLDDFGDSLLEAVSDQHPPIYEAPCPRRANVLENLARSPYPEQADCVQALLALLQDQGEKAAILNADMGTGKTIMGISAAAALHEEGVRRTLVLSPPHLVYKWRREILMTVPNAEVWVLNGPDTLVKLFKLQETIRSGVRPAVPAFYILGRVRMRMGFHWRHAVAPVRRHLKVAIPQENAKPKTKWVTQTYAGCSGCGTIVREQMPDGERVPVKFDDYNAASRRFCVHCGDPLWTLQHRDKEAADPRASVVAALKKLPTIGEKTADKLVSIFGHEQLAALLADNVYEFINLMDDDGELVFSDRQAARLERAFGRMEFSFGQGSYQPSEFIKRFLPKGTFGLCLVDEGHEYKAEGSAQAEAMTVLALISTKVILLTGTLMGGYADDLFYLLFRLLPQRMIEDGFTYNARNTLGTAATQFMREHGILKEVIREHESASFKTSRAKSRSSTVKRAPGFGPKGVTRFVLPFTVFLKLTDIGGDILPPYREHYVEVPMAAHQEASYRRLADSLTTELRAALARGDNTLLGLVLSVLLRRPDTGFRAEEVIHPRSRMRIDFAAPDFSADELSPKEEKLVQLCKQEKAKGRRSLVYTIYTGKHDLGPRLKRILQDAGLKVAVLRSSVPTEEREDWIADQVERGIDVLIANPELVKTGLDLLEFPTLVFMQTGYSVFTLMQASRRSWRIGQKEPVDVYFLGYANTAQTECLSLMAEKISVAQSTSGSMPETGLDVLNQSTDSVEIALAKKLAA